MTKDELKEMFEYIQIPDIEDQFAFRISKGKFKVEISKKYSLDEVRKAHEDLEGRKLLGPAIILPN